MHTAATPGGIYNNSSSCPSISRREICQRGFGMVVSHAILSPLSVRMGRVSKCQIFAEMLCKMSGYANSPMEANPADTSITSLPTHFPS